MSTVRNRLAAAAATLAIAATCAIVPATAAFAAAGITIVNDRGTATADPEYATPITVTASGFQSIKGGMGGVYVLFGWVNDPTGASWKPSNGGHVGGDYRYVPDSEAKDNAGFQRFVTFPGSSTKDSAQATMADDGSFTVSMMVPGATFESTDREGKVSQVDCLKVTCGIITIGAHGIKNANNETFTPITFAAATGQNQAAPAAPSAQSAQATTAEAAKPAAAAKQVAAGTIARVGIAHQTVTAGTSVVFTGQGFAPGEQVIVDFARGASSVGPLVAGDNGEVAASIPVPTTIRQGTHVVSLRGAASGQVAETEVSVTGGAAAQTQTTAAEQSPVWLLVTTLAVGLIAALLVIASIVLAIVRFVRRRKARKLAAAEPSQPFGSEGLVRDSAPDADTLVLDTVGAGK